MPNALFQAQPMPKRRNRQLQAGSPGPAPAGRMPTKAKAVPQPAPGDKAEGPVSGPCQAASAEPEDLRDIHSVPISLDSRK